MYNKIKRGLCAAILPLFLVLSLLGCSGTKRDENTRESGKTCFLTVSCVSVLDNMDQLAKEKKELIPKDGYILHKSEVKFKEGESVSDVLKRVTKEKEIHMETQVIPEMNAEYIQGIGNIYGADCGPESGWMYSVNDIFQNEGIGSILINEGDNIKILYTCDLGRDIGNEWTE